MLAAAALECSRQTLYNYAERYPAVAEVLVEERERLIDLAEQGLYHHLEEKAPWAIALTLKTLGRQRGYSDRMPLPGPTPEPSQESDAVSADEEVIVIRSQTGSNGHHA